MQTVKNRVMDRDTTEVDVAIGHENCFAQRRKMDEKSRTVEPKRHRTSGSIARPKNGKTTLMNSSKQKKPKNQVARGFERRTRMERNRKRKCNPPRSQNFSNVNDEYHNTQHRRRLTL